MTRRSIRTY